MAATVKIVGLYGAEPGTPPLEVSVQRYNTKIPTERDPGLTFPCNVPATELTNRSCWVFTGAQITGGSYSQLTQWRWFGPGNIKDAWLLGDLGGMVQVALKTTGDPGCPLGQYKQATGVSGQYGYDIQDADHGIPYYIGEAAPQDADNYTTEQPLVFDTDVYTPDTPVLITKFVVHQLILKEDTQFGEKGELTCGIRWQEI